MSRDKQNGNAAHSDGGTTQSNRSPAHMKLPALDFSTFVMSIIGSALVHLGDAPDPEAGAHVAAPNLLLARQDIELLSLMQEKTRNNLSGEEERVLGQGLYDLRTRLSEVEKQA